MIHEAELLRLNAQFETQPPQACLQWAVGTFGAHLAFVTSFQPSGLVMLHMLQSIAPQLPILTIDTQLLFDETYALINQCQQRFQLNLQRILPAQSLAQQADQYGPRLWERDADQCCQLRKVLPLRAALRPYRAWITGIRRDQSTTRRHIALISWDQGGTLLKLAPLAAWTEAQVWAYLDQHHIPYNALHQRGYPSIGCWPCTRPITQESDLRAGRWSNQPKTECGIHLQPPASD